MVPRIRCKRAVVMRNSSLFMLTSEPQPPDSSVTVFRAASGVDVKRAGHGCTRWRRCTVAQRADVRADCTGGGSASQLWCGGDCCARSHTFRRPPVSGRSWSTRRTTRHSDRTLHLRRGILAEPGPQRSDRSLRHSSRDGLPTLALHSLAGSAGEAVDGAALSFLTAQALKAKIKEELGVPVDEWLSWAISCRPFLNVSMILSSLGHLFSPRASCA